MKPLKFKEQNAVFAETQPQYVPLPAYKYKEPAGRVVFCMGLNFWEKMTLVFTGKLWVSLMSFNKPLTPSYFSVKKSDVLPIE